MSISMLCVFSLCALNGWRLSRGFIEISRECANIIDPEFLMTETA